MEIQDFGEKIGGAKKDLWRERGLVVSDLIEMNEAEKSKLIKKDNIWKKPDYQKLVQDGLPIRVAYFMKMIRDSTPTKPDIFAYDTNEERIKERQEGYVKFVGKLRDTIMSLKTEDDVLNFFHNFMEQYIIRKEYSHLVEISSSAYGCIDNKLLKSAQISDFRFLDREIQKKQFCYTNDEKILSKFKIYVLDNKNIKFIKDDYNRSVIEIQKEFGKTFLYPQGDFALPEKWKENTVFITTLGKIVKNNLASIEDAKKYILENYKEKTDKSTKTRKKGFTPKQLEHVIRTGEDYRNEKNITGNDMMETFNFKGGEFGNWLNENDRQQSLNFGYDALLDLSKALSISTTDISLGNRLSIAFGSRGSGNALAHYEPDREVINLTKMKGAGSLAHEWGHALDDIMGKEFGYKNFFTDNFRYSDSNSNTVKDIVETMKYKTICNEETIKGQKKEYEKQVNRIRIFVDSFFPKNYLNEEQTKYKNTLIQNLVDNAEKVSETLYDYLAKGSGNQDIDNLSTLRKQVIGRGLSKDERIRIAHLQKDIFQKQSNIGKPQKIQTDFYKNSIRFDELYSKTDHGYWQSTTEMFARAFACYVKDKLENRSDYLCGHAELGISLGLDENNQLTDIRAYPEGEERILINEKIDKFIEFLKEKEFLHDCKNYSLENTKDVVDDIFD